MSKDLNLTQQGAGINVASKGNEVKNAILHEYGPKVLDFILKYANNSIENVKMYYDRLSELRKNCINKLSDEKLLEYLKTIEETERTRLQERGRTKRYAIVGGVLGVGTGIVIYNYKSQIFNFFKNIFR